MGENTSRWSAATHPTSMAAGAGLAQPATDATVRGNDFRDVTYGVHVEDDGTQVLGNVFTGGAAPTAAWSSAPRPHDALHRPVTGTVISGDTSTIVGNPNPYRWVTA